MSLRETLRERTQAAHRRLDELWDVRALRQRAPYIRFLRANAAALVPLEARLVERGVGALLTDWAERTRARAIEADLAGLGAAAPFETAPALGTAAEQFGALYVLEGSRLGGVMIAREVARSEDGAVLANRRFLGHGEAGKLWRSFVEQLERVVPEAEAARACAGAQEAFALFETAAQSVASGGSDGDA